MPDRSHSGQKYTDRQKHRRMEHLHPLDLEGQPVQLLRVRPVVDHIVELVLV